MNVSNLYSNLITISVFYNSQTKDNSWLEILHSFGDYLSALVQSPLLPKITLSFKMQSLHALCNYRCTNVYINQIIVARTLGN